jgi:aminopeptidase N
LLTLTLPNELPVGRHEIALEFHGKINAQGQGLFYARYTEQGTKEKKIMLGTQFEATDARRMFPCWDEPSFRARFQLTALVPEKFLAVSNMPIEAEKKIGAKKEVRFMLTPSMASYLVVFCAGELDTIEGEQDGVKLRVVTTRGKAEQGRYALETEAKILHYYNDYFGTPFPLPKLDLIAIPGGFGGAMENWGGITYFESVLLFDPKNSSLETKERVFAVIAHEMAHQWFGDLVTMAWWDNLWLNEGFASWMGTKCTDHFNPEWNEWQRDLPKDRTMDYDARSSTHPVQQPVANEADADAAFDDITYLKGQSIIRMFESFLGPDVFREGIRKYIATHKYSNATTADLWSALTDVSGKPMNTIAPEWTEQPGFPLVEAKQADHSIAVSQSRFTLNFPNPPALTWQIPLTYEVQDQQGANSFLLRQPNDKLPNDELADHAVKLNVGDAGYYRVEYDDASWQRLLGQIGQLSEADRVNLLTDAWALVEANRKPLAFYFDLVGKVTSEDQPVVYEQISETLTFIDRLLIGNPARAQFQNFARGILRPAFDRVGWDEKPGEPAPITQLRGFLIRGLGELQDGDVVSGCRARFAAFLQDRNAIAPDLRPTIFEVVGHYADLRTWEKLHELALATTSIEEKDNLYTALFATTNPGLLARSLAITLTDELPASRAGRLLPRASERSEHPEVVWKFAEAHMPALLAKQDSLGMNRFAAGLFNYFSDAKEAEVLESYAKAKLPPGAEKAVKKAADEVRFRAELKTRLLPQLHSLGEKPSA